KLFSACFRKIGRKQLFFFLVLNYGLVDQMPASLINTRRFSFNWHTKNSAKSSGCITLSGLPSVSLSSTARSVATVLGVKVVTRMLCFRTSCINDSDKPISPNLEAL